MKPTPLVSVLMPTYNVSEFVEEAVDSILKQTYKNIEFIIVDDCSIDGTYEKLQLLAKSDPRIKLYRNPKNLKIAETLNFALSKAGGEYIARMDGDDISLPDRISKQIDFLIDNKHIDLVGLNVIVINEEGQEVKRLKFSASTENAKKMVEYFSPVPHFWVAKTEAYKKVGNYRIATVEDYDFLLRMASMNLKFCNLQEYLYKQRIRQGNTTTASGLIQRKYIEYIHKLYKERVASGSKNDSYSQEQLEDYKKVGKFEKYFFNLSNKHMYTFSLFVQSNKLKALYSLFFTLLFSPIHQGRYFFRKYKYNKILKSE